MFRIVSNTGADAHTNAAIAHAIEHTYAVATVVDDADVAADADTYKRINFNDTRMSLQTYMSKLLLVLLLILLMMLLMARIQETLSSFVLWASIPSNCFQPYCHEEFLFIPSTQTLAIYFIIS